MSPAVRRWWHDPRARTALVAAIAVGLLLADVAEARVGGGESFSSGRRSSGGGGGSYGGGGGGGGGGDGDALFFLIWLVFNYPAIGIPTVIVIALIVWFNRGPRGGFHVSRGSHYGDGAASVPAPRRRIDPLAAVRAQDPTFSGPVLLDLLQVVFRRAQEAAVTRAWTPLAPFVGEGVRASLERDAAGATRISEVVLAAIRFPEHPRGGPPPTAHTVITVVFEGTRLVASAQGERREYFEEQWQFTRPQGVRSPSPEAAHRLGCPSCGNAIDTDAMGRCRSCETPIADGRLSWHAAVRTPLVAPRPVTPPDVASSRGGEEPGYTTPTVVAPEFGTAMRAFLGRHPEWTPREFEAKVRDVFVRLQTAWSEGRWEGARPYVTDTLFQTLRFWMDGYARAGLQNRLDDVRVENVRIVNLEQDAWYESITVRIWASMKDSVVAKDGRVVGGNAEIPRRFSEYWTFVRTAGKPAAPKPADRCPNCGAPLDRIGETGVCGYCEARVTGGDHDWVLSRIEQAEVYGG